MTYNIKELNPNYDFEIQGASYVGEPRDNTMMYVSKKVEKLVDNINGHKNCLIFIENGIDVPENLKHENCFFYTDNPQLAYAKFATNLEKKQREQEMKWGYQQTSQGYYVGHNTKIGKNAYIEPGVVIGHNVVIGDDAVILAGATIKHSIIGNNFLCNENAVVGANGFNMAVDENGNKMRLPSLGRVIIGNFVEIGTNDNISRGSGNDTVINDYVKLDSLVYIAHDVHIGKNAEIVAGCVLGGYDTIGENTFIGFNSAVRNRLVIESNVLVGMGATVVNNIENGLTVIGSPAKPYIKRTK